MPGLLALLKTVNRTPSKRARPSSVAIQRKPSPVWWRPVMMFCGSPSSAVHDSKPVPRPGRRGLAQDRQQRKRHQAHGWSQDCPRTDVRGQPIATARRRRIVPRPPPRPFLGVCSAFPRDSTAGGALGLPHPPRRSAPRVFRRLQNGQSEGVQRVDSISPCPPWPRGRRRRRPADGWSALPALGAALTAAGR